VGHTSKRALFEEFARLGKALANPARLELIDLLAQGQRTVEALAAAAGLAVSTTSAHLQTLKHAHLVTTRREGTRVYHALAGDDVAGLYAQLRAVAQTYLPDTETARRAYLRLDTDGDPARAEISRDELLERARNGRLTVLDTRPAQEYAQGHLPGAVSIPIDELPQRLAELPTEGTIVAYCRGGYCAFAYEAVRALTSHGYHAIRLADGILEWRLTGLPITTEAA
jgi:rhodanese-related sulfurtransferase